MRTSKHRQFDSDGKHIKGECKIDDNSGLRKLMRAAKRGTIPAERLGVMKRAVESAALRHLEYVSGFKRRAVLKDGQIRLEAA